VFSFFQKSAGFFPPHMDWWFDSFPTESFNRRFPAFGQRGDCRHNRPVCEGFQESFGVQFKILPLTNLFVVATGDRPPCGQTDHYSKKVLVDNLLKTLVEI
jgi:hypothetical protein